MSSSLATDDVGLKCISSFATAFNSVHFKEPLLISLNFRQLSNIDFQQ